MNEGPRASSGAALFAEERRAWRSSLLRLLLWVHAASMLVATVGALTVDAPALLPGYGVITLVTLALAKTGACSYRVRVGWLLGSMYLTALTALVGAGPVPAAFVLLCSMSVFATLLLGRRAGVLAITLAALLVTGVGLSWWSGALVHSSRWVETLDMARPLVLARLVTMFVMAATLMSIAPWVLIRRAEGLALEKAIALDALSKEQEGRAKVEAELAAREARYQRAQQLELLGRLSGTVAHDFNNALSVMMPALAELEDATLPHELHEAVRDIRLAAEQARGTITELRVFRQVTPSGGLPLRPVELGAALARAKATLRRVMPPNVKVALELDAQGAAPVEEAQLFRVLANLALNARDAMREGGQLTLRLRADGAQTLAIDVVDTGHGMSDAVQRRLFEPYFTTKGDQGTGLGLASVRQVVEGFGGRLELQSSVGRGTTVTVWLPRA